MLDHDIVIPGLALNVPFILDGYGQPDSYFGIWIHLGSVIFLIAIALILNGRWIMQQVKQFKPYKRSNENPLEKSDSGDDNTILPPITNQG